MSLLLPSPPLPDPSAHGGDGARPSVVINKRQLAKLIGVSLPTVSALIERYSDQGFPVARRGTNGVEWQFDGAAVVEFLRDRQAEEAATRSARDELLAQLVLPLEPPPAGATATVISVKDQLDALKLREALRKEAETAGRLVDAAEVEARFGAVFSAMNREFHAFIRRLGTAHQWPDEVLRKIDTDLNEMQHRLVREAAGEDQAEDDRQLAIL